MLWFCVPGCPAVADAAAAVPPRAVARPRKLAATMMRGRVILGMAESFHFFGLPERVGKSWLPK
jgi:hypothetical protein